MRDTCDAEDSRSVDGHTRNTDPFLHDLEPDDQLHSAAGVQLASADAEEHMNVRVPMSTLAFELDGVADILIFGLGFAHVISGFTSKTT